jgi:hypothetical protein
MPQLRRPPDPEGVWSVIQITTVDHEVVDVAVCGATDEPAAALVPAPAAVGLQLDNADTLELSLAVCLANPTLFAGAPGTPVCERETLGSETEFDEPALRWVEELAHVDQDGSLATYWKAVEAHRAAGDGAASWHELASPHGWPLESPACDGERQRFRLVERRTWDDGAGLAASVHSIEGRLRLVVCGEPAAVVPRCEAMHSAAESTNAGATASGTAAGAAATADGAPIPLLSGTLSIDAASGFIKLNDDQREFLAATARAMGEPSDEEVLAGTARLVRSYGQRWLTEPLPGILKAVGIVPTGFDSRQVTERLLKEFARDFGRTFGKRVIGVVSGDRPSEIRALEDLCGLGSAEEEQRAVAAMDDEAKRAQLNSAVSSLLQANGLELAAYALDACCKRVLYNLTVTPAIDLAIGHECPPALYQARFVLLVGGDPVQLRVCTATYVGGPVAGDQPQVMHTPYLLRMMTPNLLDPELERDGALSTGGELQYTTAFTMDPSTESLVNKDGDWYTDAVEQGAWESFADCWHDPTIRIERLLAANPSAHEVALLQKEALANSLATGDLSGAGGLLRENFKNLEKSKDGVRAGIKIVQEVKEDARKVREGTRTPDQAQAVSVHDSVIDSQSDVRAMVVPEGVPPTGEETADAGHGAAEKTRSEPLVVDDVGDAGEPSPSDTPSKPPAVTVSSPPGSPRAASQGLDLHGLCFLGHIAVGGQPASSAARIIEERRVLAEVHASRRRRQMVHNANVLRREDEKQAQEEARARAKEQLLAIDRGAAKEAAASVLADDKVVQAVDGAKRAIQDSETAQKAQALLKGGAVTSLSSEGGPQVLDASKLLGTGKELLSEMIEKSAVVDGAGGSPDGSLLDGVRKIEGVAKILDSNQSKLADVAAASGANPELARLRQEGKSILSTTNSPMQVMQAMRSQPEFVERLKRTCIRFLEDAVAGTEVPPIEGTQSWGNYGLYGITIGKVVIPSDLLEIGVATRVTVTVAKLRLALDPFAYSFEKTQWPRLRDTGAATAAASDLSASITFGVVAGSSETDVPRVDNIDVTITVGEMSVVVDSAKGGGSQRWLYNKLLLAFSERCRSTVQSELQQAAQRGVAILSQRVQEAIRAFTAGGGGGVAGAGVPAVTKAAGVGGGVGDTGPEQEPEPEPEAEPFEF